MMKGECDQVTAPARPGPHRIAARLLRSRNQNGGTMLTYLLNYLRDEEGQSLAEYALILVLVSIAAIGAMTTLGTNVGSTFGSISGQLGTSS